MTQAPQMQPAAAFRSPQAAPKLLVSVRNADEAWAALQGGCNLLDIKEPARGSLGMAAPETLHAVCEAVCQAGEVETVRTQQAAVPSGKRPLLSAALGETNDWLNKAVPDFPGLPPSLSFCKLGTAGLKSRRHWQNDWLTVRRRFEERAGKELPWIAVAYADWQRARAPSPESVITAALESGCRGVLFDTFFKEGETLTDLLPPDSLARLVEQIRRAGLLSALAGRISAETLSAVQALRPDIIAVRSAACRGGDRNGRVCREAVSQIVRLLQNHS